MRRKPHLMPDQVELEPDCPLCPDSPDSAPSRMIEEKTRAITLAQDRGNGGRWLRGGASPNPNGRPSIPVEVKQAARAHTLDMIAVLVEVAHDKRAPPAARVAAASAVLDRGHGKPVTSVEAKIAKVDLSQMHLDALREHLMA